MTNDEYDHAPGLIWNIAASGHECRYACTDTLSNITTASPLLIIHHRGDYPNPSALVRETTRISSSGGIDCNTSAEVERRDFYSAVRFMTASSFLPGGGKATQTAHQALKTRGKRQKNRRMLTMIVLALVICEITEDLVHQVAKMLYLLGLGADQSQRLVRQCCSATVKSAITQCIASMPSRTLRTP